MTTLVLGGSGATGKFLVEELLNRGEKVRVVVRCLLPPHSDNEMAADYLASQVGLSSEAIEWVVVRPDRLLNELKVSKYTIHPSPIRSSIFNSRVTSRINVSHFMADLIDNGEVWGRWQGKMPVIYNSVSNFK